MKLNPTNEIEPFNEIEPQARLHQTIKKIINY
jgi:hypothetical protein